MQTTLNRLTSPVRSFAAGTWVALFALLTLCLAANPAMAGGSSSPIVVSGTPVLLAPLTGGWDGSQEPIGGTFVIGVNGDVLIGDGYSSNVLQITPSGTPTTLASGVGAANATLDGYGNLYFGGNYNANLYKVPYNAATGQYVGWTTTPTTNCLGGNQDTSPCIFAPAVAAYVNTLGGQGYAGVVFDGQGNFYFETNTLPTTNPNTIFECNVACISSSSATPTVIYKDSNPIGALAIDPWGNLFFIDGVDNTGKLSYLNEIPLSSGSYASTPTVLETYTSSAGNNGLSGLAISGNGTLFFITNNDGIFAIPNTQSGGPNPSGIYMVSTEGGKGVAIDSQGNLYALPYDNTLGKDTVFFIPVGSFSLGASPKGTAATAVSATIFDSAASCTTPPTLALSVTEFGATTTEFTAAAGATCSTAFSGSNGTFAAAPFNAAAGSSFSVTANFTPKAVGERNAALTITDATNSASGTTALAGVGQGAMANLDPGVWTSYTTGFTKPYSVSVDAAGDMAVADEGGEVYWIPAGSPAGTAPTSIGSGFVEPAATAFDANGNLYIADFSTDEVVKIPDVSGALAPTSQSTLIPATMVFDGTALSKPSGLAVGPDGRLYIADLGNNRVVSYDLITGQTAVPLTGLKNPWGIAVDPSNNLYVADTGNGNVLVDMTGAQTTLTVPGVSAPWGVVIDPSGSLVVSDHATGNIVWVPNISATLTTASAVMIEKNPSSALGIALDTMGDLYTTDATGKAVYAIQRTAASLNFGTVQDGVPSNTETIYAEVTGNMPVTLGTPAFTAPTSSDFTLTSTLSNNKCTGGSSGSPGQDCQIQSVFTPAVGTAAGSVSATATLSSNALNLASATIYLTGTATVSAVLAQTITGFTPPSSLLAGQQITLSATGGASGNTVTFSIDPASSCPTCATINGITLTANAVGSVIVDANQAGGNAGGNAYAAATQVQATIAITSPTPAGEPNLVMTQTINFPSILTGGVLAGPISGGTSFGVGNNGYVAVSETYGGSVAIYSLAAGTVSALGPYSNPGAVTADSQGNLYISGQYNNTVAKLPFVNGAYATLTSPTSSTASCTSSSTTECIVAPVAAASIGGIAAMTFDAQGDLFIGTDDQGSNQHSIWECTAACLASGTPAPAMIFQEPTGSSPATTGQLYIGGLGVDPWGNLFFTDTNFINQAISSPNNEATYSDLYELPYTSGTGFAKTPILLQTYTNSSPGGYDDNLDAVAVNSSGTVYYATLYDGVFAIPNTQTGGPKIADQYSLSASGAKAIEVDANGNVYEASGGLSEILVNDLTVPTAQLDGAATTASATVVDNVVGCGTAATLAFTSSNPEFSATAGATCSSISAGGGFKATVSTSSYPATITFTATKPNTQTATLTVADTTNGGEGTATVTGFVLTTPQTLTFTAPTTTTYTYSPGMKIVVSVTNGGSNNPAAFTVDSTSTGAGTFSGTTVTGTTSSTTLTVSQAGSIVIDANEPGGLASGTYYDAASQVQLTLTIGKASEAITLTPPTSPVVYSPGLTVNLSAIGGGASTPVVFTVDASSTGAGTVSTTTVAGNTSSATLTVTQAGTIVLDANQASDVNYLAAPQVQQVLVVNQASQTITFTPVTTPLYYIVSCSIITQCATIQIQATGGATNNLIAISPDPKNGVAFTILSSSVTNGITTTTLALVPNQTLPSPANLVIDGNQQGNSSYAAATQAQITIPVLSSLPLQTITWANPGTQVAGATLTLNATASSGFAVTYTSGTTSVCTVSGSKVTFANETSASACTITVSQPGDNKTYAAAVPLTQTFAVNPAGQSPNLSMSLSIPSLIIQPGTVGLTQITLTSVNNFAASSIAFSCSGLPTGYTCAFNPNPVTVFAQSATTGMPLGTTVTTTLTITPPATAAVVRQDFRPLFPATLAVALCFLGFKKRNRLFMLVLLVALFAGLGVVSGCGGTSSSSTTPPATSTATITATPAAGLAGASGSVTSSATLSVTLE